MDDAGSNPVEGSKPLHDLQGAAIVKNGKYLAVFLPTHPNAWSTGYVAMHRAVAENEIGRLLTSEEHVHHRNGNSRDNSPGNLQVVSAAEHALIHRRPVTMLSMTCDCCGRSFQRRLGQDPEKKGYRAVFCSRKCNGIAQRQKQIEASRSRSSTG